MTRASSRPSRAQSSEGADIRPNEPANTMDEPGGPEAPLAELDAEEIARAAAKRAREEGSRDRSSGPARQDKVDPDFKPPMAHDPAADAKD
ncbi:hypothetical protein QYH69_08160 [Paraburkholderia sp. SARCC-3016]|uniref:hypothetical protein n=1 Tax=Paraburkholderia sp. SARCC-3016 TaxID=3058611 RepID=UPI00280714D4|nr:hypothetical protein [Paraburkholderia sp. SARCC-3016]MDQ7977218.1 hypothetical protein [Paraburkholderia sp. SARCC-3016]